MFIHNKYLLTCKFSCTRKEKTPAVYWKLFISKCPEKNFDSKYDREKPLGIII